jgi:hypothetical protein
LKAESSKFKILEKKLGKRKEEIEKRGKRNYG